MSFQSGLFSSSPVNFSRFLDMTRSSSRSLSPERELKQMMAHGRRPQSGAPKVSASPRHSSSRAVPETAASAAATSFTRPMSIPVDGSESRSTSAGAASAASPQLTTSLDTRTDRSPYFTNIDTDTERSNSNTDVFSAALQWQYGSPLFYPVTQAFYCWNGHTLSPKRRCEYGDLEGVSCDFCGFTHWLDTPAKDTKEKKSAEKPPQASRGKKQKHKTVKREENEEKESAPVDFSPSETIFFHCDTCGVDLCLQCLEEVREDERYHVPCMKCLKCLAYVSLQQTAAHRCPTATATTAVTASQATLVVDSFKPEDRGALLKLEAGALPVKVEQELDLLGHTATESRPHKHATPPAVPVRPRGGRPRNSARASVAEGDVDRSPANAASVGAREGTGRASPRRKVAKVETDAFSTPNSTVPAPAPRPVKGLWAVQITTRTAADRAEAIRLATDQGLAVDEEASRKRALVFHLPTRLAAEKCAGRARESGLEAAVQRNR